MASKFQPTPEQIKKVGKLSSAERAKRQKYVDNELGEIYATLRKARVHGDSEEYRKRRIEVLQDQIEREKQALARKLHWLEKQIKDIQQESELLPIVIEANKKKAKELEEERMLLRHGKQIANLYEAMTLAGLL